MKKIMLLIITITFFSCRKPGCEDDGLKMIRTNYIGNDFKINGYYFGDINEQEKSANSIFYFYRNGIVFSGGAVSLMEARQGIAAHSWGEAGNAKFAWGLFTTNGDVIEIEQWTPGLCGTNTLYERGNIINDTSFIITTRETRVDGKVQRNESVESIFYFRSADKPDSTNKFIQ